MVGRMYTTQCGEILNMRQPLIYWRDVPMDVDSGSFEYIANNWGAPVFIVCFHDFPTERKLCAWKQEKIGSVKIILVPNVTDASNYLKNLIRDHPDAIHIFSGMRGEKESYLKNVIQTNLKPNIVILAERPFLYGSRVVLLLKKLCFRLLYGFLNAKYGGDIRCFLPMGEIGVQTYTGYGWNKDRFFPYMYNPKLSVVHYSTRCNTLMKFLYIGRFDANSKGVDILMSAIDKLPEDGSWSLDMVGGYGALKDQVLSWCEKKESVRFVGSWENPMVCENMSAYDVCIVPSKYDGWNLAPNQAIHAGIATVITDEAGSDELIRYSKAGLVVKANNADDLHRALTLAISDHPLVDTWKNNAIQYREYISSETVGNYFIDILNYSFTGEVTVKPHCPWEL